MARFRNGFTKAGLFLAILLFFEASQASAMNNTVAWPQDSIDSNELTQLFNKSSGHKALNINFPNHTNWNVQQDQIEQLENNYTSQAQTKGFNLQNLPPLEFSSTGAQGMIPTLQNMNPLQMSQYAESFLQNVPKQHLEVNFLPGWMQGIVDWVYSVLLYVGTFFANAFRSSLHR